MVCVNVFTLSYCDGNGLVRGSKQFCFVLINTQEVFPMHWSVVVVGITRLLIPFPLFCCVVPYRLSVIHLVFRSVLAEELIQIAITSLASHVKSRVEFAITLQCFKFYLLL